MFEQVLADRLQEYQGQQLYRQRTLLGKPETHHLKVQHQDQVLLSFCSNDYLGLAHHPQVVEAYKQAAEAYGVGSGASHLISGYHQPHYDLEQAFAKFLRRDRALLFNTGYMANIGVLQALSREQDVIYQDKLNHASLIDAGLLAKAKMQRYAHRDFTHLKNLLARQTQGQKFIVTDGVFSMGGDLAPLPELIALAQAEQACLIVDDAHGIGILGSSGGGVAEHFNVTQRELPVLICPLGKAFGCFGAVVAGSDLIIESLVQFARTYIYTTAIPPALACAALASLKIISAESKRREYLYALIDYFKKAAVAQGIALVESTTPIQSLILGSATRAINLQKYLYAHGFLTSNIRPPTVPTNTSRLRITLSCLHTHEHIDQLLKAISNALNLNKI
jgi:8-amino-7-oxononanoate synthase